jgi:hypothetical protein
VRHAEADLKHAHVAPGFVYMAASSSGETLYIGSTGDLRRRIGEHRLRAAWWPETTWFNAAVVANRSLALEFEKRLIADHEPAFNVHFQGWEFRREEFGTLPAAATRRDLESVMALRSSYVDYATRQFERLRGSATLFLALSLDNEETVGECTERLRLRGIEPAIGEAA